MTFGFVAALLLCASCQKFAEGRQAFREVLALRDQITAEFHDPVADVSMDIVNDKMTVKFASSQLRTREERQQRADAVAAFVTSHYKHPLKSVAVQFGAASETFVGQLGK